MFNITEWNGQKSLRLKKDKKFLKGSIILILDGEVTGKQTQTSIKIGDYLHIEDEFGRYMNHSCYPNTKIEGIRVIALTDIKPGDEITFNYQDSEDFPLASPFECSCCGEMIS